MIDKNIPLPKKEGMTALMKNLEIGDSFEIDPKKRNQVPSIANQCGISVVSKKQENGMVRVWRTS